MHGEIDIMEWNIKCIMGFGVSHALTNTNSLTATISRTTYPEQAVITQRSTAMLSNQEGLSPDIHQLPILRHYSP